MNNKFAITATDGKVFTGTLDNYTALVNEVKVYEADLKIKKEKEEADEARAALEAAGAVVAVE